MDCLSENSTAYTVLAILCHLPCKITVCINILWDVIFMNFSS